MDALRQIDGWPAAHAAPARRLRPGRWDGGDAERTYGWPPSASCSSPTRRWWRRRKARSIWTARPAREGSTFRHLLSHASGLGPDGDRLAPPERSRIYSNGGYDLLADELARHARTCRSSATSHESVVAPLGLSAELAVLAGAGIAASLADMLAFGARAPRAEARGARDARRGDERPVPGLVGVLPGYGRMEPNDWGLGFELKDAKSRTGRVAPTPSDLRALRSKAGTATFLWVDRSAGVACAALADESFGDWAREAWPRLSDAVLAEASAEA